MIKLFIDDKRPAPEGWHLVTNVRDALEFIDENSFMISHISFDYYLSDDGYRTSMDILRSIDADVFHQPLENYTFHSSDSSMNDKMAEFVRSLVDPESKQRSLNKSKGALLQRMRKSKGRR